MPRSTNSYLLGGITNNGLAWLNSILGGNNMPTTARRPTREQREIDPRLFSTYMLDENGNPINPATWDEFHNWNSQRNRRMARDCLFDYTIDVITIFEINPSIAISGHPLFWTTSIIGGARHGYVWRATCRERAWNNHLRAVAYVNGQIPLPQ